VSVGDPILVWMRKHGIPVTRANYLALDYLGNPPEEIGPEIEAELPREIQLPEWREDEEEEEEE
jgi:hypothetical protein